MDKLKSRWNVFIGKLKQRKILITSLLAIIFLLLIAFMASTFMSTNSSPNSNSEGIRQQIITTSQIENTVTISPAVITPVNGIPKWISYTGTNFSLEYPEDWSLQKEAITKGGKIITIRANALPPGINYPQFILETEPGGQVQIEQKTSIMKALGLIESKTEVLGMPAIKLKGTIPFKIVGGQIVKQPIWETSILLSNGANIYVFKYEYEGVVDNPVMDDFFQGFIDGVKIKS